MAKNKKTLKQLTLEEKVSKNEPIVPTIYKLETKSTKLYKKYIFLFQLQLQSYRRLAEGNPN